MNIPTKESLPTILLGAVLGAASGGGVTHYTNTASIKESTKLQTEVASLKQQVAKLWELKTDREDVKIMILESR